MPYQTQCMKIQLKPNSLERVREWAATLNESRRAEALATLRDQTVVFEAAFLDHTVEGESGPDRAGGAGRSAVTKHRPGGASRRQQRALRKPQREESAIHPSEIR
jgi:hypothetical protein